MKVMRSAALALAIGLLGAGSALAAEQADCCKDKGKPCCEEKDGKKMPCCDEHKDHGKPDAPKPAPQGEHQHQH